MRVIRTEMFFDDVQGIGPGASKAVRLNPGIGVAFFGISPPRDFPFRSLLKSPVIFGRPSEIEVRRFLDLAVRGSERSYGRPYSKYWQDDIYNARIVDFVMSANIVVEQSPPTWEQLKSVLYKKPEIAIGAFVGYHLAGTHAELMMLRNL